MKKNLADINKDISRTKEKLAFLEKKMSLKKEYKNKLNLDARKKRAHLLIKKGVLFEMLNLLDEDNEIVLGFLSTFPTDENIKNKLKEIGDKIFKEYKSKKKS